MFIRVFYLAEKERFELYYSPYVIRVCEISDRILTELCVLRKRMIEQICRRRKLLFTELSVDIHRG